VIDRRERADRKLARLSETNGQLRKQESFWRSAHQEALTGLWNCRYADAGLAEELGRAHRVPGYRLSVQIADRVALPVPHRRPRCRRQLGDRVVPGARREGGGAVRGGGRG